MPVNMVSFRSLLPLIPLWQVACAQTLVVDNTTIAANESTVAPAVEVVESSQYTTAESLQLTDAVLANLTALELTNISLFGFGDSSNSTEAKRSSWSCKTVPGDFLWPIGIVWDVFDLLLGDALIKTVPLASPCYDTWGNKNSAECTFITDQWTNSSLHYGDPTSVMSPVWEGLTCLPTPLYYNCTLGGYPSYAVNVTKVSQIQLAVNFARNLNIRLVVKNTGHDFNGRSSGAYALSIWTHHLKSIDYYESYKAANGYTGPVFKLGSGVQGFEVYEAAEKYGVTAVGGEGRTVGMTGGYLAGGGHSPMSPSYGIGADQVLSVDVVTPDGRFLTCDDKQNTELFWALRGGGGSTFGVVTSWTVKVFPKLPVASIMTFNFATSANVSTETFYAGVKAYFQNIPQYNAAKNYEYFFLINSGDGNMLFLMAPWFAPNMTVAQLQDLTAPLMANFSALGIDVSPVYGEYNSFYSAWSNGFPQETVAQYVSKTTARLIPTENFINQTKWEETWAAFQYIFDNGGSCAGFGITGGPGPYPDNAVNPAWRNAAMHVIPWIQWDSGAPLQEIANLSKTLTNDWMAPLRAATPGSGAYASEGDVTEPDFQQSFYGTAKYERLYALKQKIDPTGLFYANKAVGSENWYITGQLDGLPTQNGRLCPV